jgi:hypothetical protein
MNEQDRALRIKRAQVLFREIHHIPIATVNVDGSPHCSPVFMAFGPQLEGYWVSHPESDHSKNIARDSRVFLTIFDSREGHGGLFLAGTAIVLSEPPAITKGLAQLQAVKKELYGKMGSVADYTGPGKQCVYHFIPVRAWVNHSDKRGETVIRDRRYEVSIDELLTKPHA